MQMQTLRWLGALIILAISASPGSAQTETGEPDPAALRIVEAGSEFAVVAGDTIGITRDTRIFAVESVDAESGGMEWQVSDLETGENANATDYEGDLLILDDECRLLLYDLTPREEGPAVASLRLHCSDG